MDRQILTAKQLHEQFAADFATLVQYATPILVEQYGYQFGERQRIGDTCSMLVARSPDLSSRVRILISLGEHDQAHTQVTASLAALKEADEFLFLPTPSVGEYALLLSVVTGNGVDPERRRAHQIFLANGRRGGDRQKAPRGISATSPPRCARSPHPVGG